LDPAEALVAASADTPRASGRLAGTSPWADPPIAADGRSKPFGQATPYGPKPVLL